jgi:hypothetical protein
MRPLRALAVVRDYDGLVAAIRARRDELKTTHLVIDDVAGLQTGYTSKLLSDPPIRNLGVMSLGPLLGTLGLALAIVHDGEALRRVQDRLTPRRHAPKRANRTHSWFTAETGREMALRRAAKMTAKARSRSASRAAKARWRRPKFVEVTGAVTHTARRREVRHPSFARNARRGDSHRTNL